MIKGIIIEFFQITELTIWLAMAWSLGAILAWATS